MTDSQLQNEYTHNNDVPCGICEGYEEDHDDNGECIMCPRCGFYLGQHEITDRTFSGEAVYKCPQEGFYD